VRSTSSSLRGAGHHVMVEGWRRCFDSAQKQERDRRCEERCHHGREISCFDAKDMWENRGHFVRLDSHLFCVWFPFFSICFAWITLRYLFFSVCFAWIALRPRLIVEISKRGWVVLLVAFSLWRGGYYCPSWKCDTRHSPVCS
jgi:hypothetical protein